MYISQVSLGTGEYGLGGAIAVITVLLMMAISAYYVRHIVREEEL